VTFKHHLLGDLTVSRPDPAEECHNHEHRIRDKRLSLILCRSSNDPADGVVRAKSTKAYKALSACLFHSSMTTFLPRSLKLTTSIACQFRPIRISSNTFVHHTSRSIKTFSTAPPRFATMPTMKEAIVSAGPKVEIKDSPIPEPGPDDVIIKVVVSGYVLYSILL